MLALSIYIIGCNNLPKEDKRPKRTSFKHALERFEKRFPQITKLGIRKMEFLHAHYYMNPYDIEEVSRLNDSLLGLVERIGEIACGDEKLYHFTGKSMNVRYVPQKRDVGLWIYELNVRISSSLYFVWVHPSLLYFVHCTVWKRKEKKQYTCL